MKIIRRFIYLLYYLKQSDLRELKSFLLYSSSLTGRTKAGIISDIVLSAFRYNISIKDYFCFRFFDLEHSERLNWAGSGFMYEYQLIMNPKENRSLLADKIEFLNHYDRFINRKHLSILSPEVNLASIKDICAGEQTKLVLKNSKGQIGAEVEVIDCSEYSPESLFRHIRKKKYNLIEEYIEQHPSLMALSPSGLNTVRVLTQLDKGVVHFLGARLRISVNSNVDNMAAGNLAAPVNLETGVIEGPAVYSNITREDQEFHPVTGVKITGFKIPFWNRVIDLCRKAALHRPENRSVGWDIAITEKGPELVEGNHNWCRLLWQMPVKKGLKYELEKYL